MCNFLGFPPAIRPFLTAMIAPMGKKSTPSFLKGYSNLLKVNDPEGYAATKPADISWLGVSEAAVISNFTLAARVAAADFLDRFVVPVLKDQKLPKAADCFGYDGNIGQPVLFGVAVAMVEILDLPYAVTWTENGVDSLVAWDSDYGRAAIAIHTVFAIKANKNAVFPAEAAEKMVKRICPNKMVLP